MLKLYNAECVLPIKKVTKLSTLCEIFNHRESTKECLSEVHSVDILHVCPYYSPGGEGGGGVVTRRGNL